MSKAFRKYLERLNNLPNIYYNKRWIVYRDINAFVASSKKDNDKNNKIRESIIGAIINNKIPEKYYKYSRRWVTLKRATELYVYELVNLQPCNISNISNNNIRLIHKGSRKYNYDFTIIANDTEYNIELKFNAENIEDAPQFVSPIKTDKYMSQSYEEYYYDNYLPQLISRDNDKYPERNIYLKEIHGNKPKCMNYFQDVYYKGCKKSSRYTGDKESADFYELSNNIDKISRKAFVNIADLNIRALSQYLQETQKNKIYMLYKNNRFHIQIANIEDYELVRWERYPEKFKYIAYSASGKHIDILLRWKNGNGIAFPAFQIS
jgi:hypothetical protein